MTDKLKLKTDHVQEILRRIREDDVPAVAELDAEIRALCQWIAFLQHERLIHLLVTILFALLTIMTFGIYLITQFLPIVALLLLFLALLIPYIVHYYRLENGVQRLYGLYDEITKAREEKYGYVFHLP